MSWASIVAAALRIAGAVADYLKTRQLLDAGRAVQRDKDRSETDRRVDAGRRAADADRLPDDTEFRD
jgi:hypothetical protein